MPISDSTASLADAEVSSRVAEVRERIAAATARGGHGQPVTLVAVTKTHGPEAVLAAWRAGVMDVGENRVQEAEVKMSQIDVPVRWHLIGHLQRNKVKSATRFALVHGVDSDRLAEALDVAARTVGATLDVLMQVNVSGEDSKSGVEPGEVSASAERWHGLRNLRVMGAMVMAPFDAPETILRAVFAGARDARTQLLQAGHPAPWLSMGMSGDYEVAVEEGATHVRLGTMLFGTRT
ncbi:MAG: YggS family pyridoxal phosphate-dependent enzyme [Gemmatimonas sp.]